MKDAHDNCEFSYHRHRKEVGYSSLGFVIYHSGWILMCVVGQSNQVKGRTSNRGSKLGWYYQNQLEVKNAVDGIILQFQSSAIWTEG